MRGSHLTAWLVVLLLPISILAQGEQPADEGAAPAAAVAKEAEVMAVEGTVDVRRPTDKDWIPAEVGMKLPQDAEVSTGYGAKAVLLLAGIAEVTVESLTQVKLAELSAVEGTLRSDLKLDIGSMKIDVKKGDLKADLKVSTPNSTASVRGTRFEILSSPDRGDRCRCNENRVQVRDRGRGRQMEIGMQEWANTEDGMRSAVEQAQESNFVDTNPIGFTTEERAALVDYGVDSDVPVGDLTDTGSGSNLIETSHAVQREIPPVHDQPPSSGDGTTTPTQLPAPPGTPQ